MEIQKVNISMDVQIKRLGDFVAIKFDLPKHLKQWLFDQSGYVTKIFDAEFFDREMKKDDNFMISRSEKVRKNTYFVVSQEYLDAYKSGDLMRANPYEYEISKKEEQFDCVEDCTDRICQMTEANWLSRFGEEIPRNYWIEAWPTYFGNPKKIKEIAEKSPYVLDVDICDNPVELNWEISGRQRVYIKIDMNKENTKKYIDIKTNQGYYQSDDYLLTELIGLSRIEQHY